MRPAYKKRRVHKHNSQKQVNKNRRFKKRFGDNVNNNSSSTQINEINNARSTTENSVAVDDIIIDEAKVKEIVKEIAELKKELCDKTENLKNLEKNNLEEYNNLSDEYNELQASYLRQKSEWDNLREELLYKHKVSEQNLKHRRNQLEQINQDISHNCAAKFHEMEITKKYYQCIKYSIKSEALGEKISSLEDKIAELNKSIPKLKAVKKALEAELARVEDNKIAAWDDDMTEIDDIIKKTEEEFEKNL